MTQVPSRAGVRSEIQALRAAAVVAVVVYHLWPDAVRGGFVGVDVFFVISGFLITAHLVRSPISLSRFWARRIRRLLPASLLVLAVSSVAIAVLVPAVYWRQFFREVAASALYLENWQLAGDSVNYLAADNVASPVQHFWSLSAEEQFYLVWPLLILLAVVIGRRMPRLPVLPIALAAVTLASLALSIWLTATDPTPAYFITPVRAWEFGAGGLLALISRRLPRPAAWLGWLLIAGSALLFTPDLPFPGATALVPVVGALLVLAAAAPSRVERLAPVQFVGDISYSLYLWHWPLIVIVPFAVDGVPAVVLLVAAVVLAWLSTRFVENPVRRSAMPRRVAFAGMVVAAGLVVGGAAVGSSAIDARVAESDRAISELQLDGCLGAATLATGCDPGPGPVLPDPLGMALPDHCVIDVFVEHIRPCVTPGGPVGIAVIGDSHSDALAPAVLAFAADRGLTATQLAKGSCPLTTAHRTDGAARPRAEMDRMNSSCDTWNGEVLDYLAAHPEITTVVTSASARNHFYAENGATQFDTAVAGFAEAIERLPASVTSIVVVRDVPRLGVDVPVCVDAHRDDPAACGRDRADALVADPLVAAAEASVDPRIRVVDLSDYLCTDDTCPAVIGNVLVFRDTQHLTPLFARTLAPYLGAALATPPTR